MPTVKEPHVQAAVVEILKSLIKMLLEYLCTRDVVSARQASSRYLIVLGLQNGEYIDLPKIDAT